MKIKVGSNNSEKIKAVQEACTILGINTIPFGFNVSSEVNSQPIGFNEIYTGAFNRAIGARGNSSDVVAVGIENGIIAMQRPGASIEYFDTAVIVIINEQGENFVTTSPGIKFPTYYVDKARQAGFETTTAGSIIAEELGGNQSDPHSTITHGTVSRHQTLVTALVVALRQLIKNN
jgi:non-canonical (house-cleaning) NTP pyrophosphatase